jgi:hypothetical protein
MKTVYPELYGIRGKVCVSMRFVILPDLPKMKRTRTNM